MIEFLIPVLVFVAVVCGGFGVLMISILRRRPITSRILGDAIAASPQEERRQVARVLRRFGNAFSFGRTSNALKVQLARAGFYSEGATSVYLGAKVSLLGVGLTVLGVLIAPQPWHLALRVYLIILGAAILFFLPNMIIRSRLSRRTREVRNHLPNAIDLLEVCVSSGMGLDMAWNSVSDEIRPVSSVLADEMALTNLEIQLGASRPDALRNLAERSGADEFSSLVALLVQSERFGTSIADALETFATTMRETRSQRAEEAAEKMAVKLLFPLVLFIFPVMLIVMVGPAALTLVKVIGGP